MVRTASDLTTGLIEGPGAYIVNHALVRMTGLPVEYLETIRTQGQEDWLGVGRRLARLLDEERVRQGLRTLNWRLVDTLKEWAQQWSGERLNADDRDDCMTIALYVQRLCAKCETNGAFGPVAWALLDPDSPVTVRGLGESIRDEVTRRIVTIPYWVVDSVFSRFALPALSSEKRVPRAHPLLRISGDYMHRIDIVPGPPVAVGPRPVPAEVSRIMLLSDGERTVAEVAACVGKSVEATMAILVELENTGWLVIGPEIPTGLSDPLAWLDLWARENLPPSHMVHETITALKLLAETYRLGNDEQRGAVILQISQMLTAMVGQGSRGEGQFYADRYPLFEDAGVGHSIVQIGSPVVEILRHDLVPYVRALLAVPATRWSARHRRIASWYRKQFEDSPMPLTEVLLAAHNDAEAIKIEFERAEVEAEEVAKALWDGALLAHWNGLDVEAVVESRELLAVAERYLHISCATQVDIMLLPQGDGAVRVVLADIHATHDLLLNGPYVRLCATPDELVRSVAEAYHLTYKERIATPILAHTDQTITSLSMPGLDVEFAGRSRKLSQQRIPASALRVIPRGDRLELAVENDGPIRFSRIPVWHPHGRDSFLALFASPFVDRMEEDVFPSSRQWTKTPRIVFGQLVGWRRSWRLTSSEVSTHDRRSFGESMDAWAESRGLPERVFARIPTERKPVLIDRRNPFLCEWLRRRFNRSHTVVHLVEMYPDVGDLWLRGSGGAYCAEIRLSLFLSGGDTSA